MPQAHSDLLDSSQPLPWEQPRVSEDDDLKLGKFRHGILQLLQRDPAARATARDFSVFVREVFSSVQIRPSQGDARPNAEGGMKTGGATTLFHDVNSCFQDT